MTLVGGIEAGGTKFVCGVGTGPGELQTTSFPTTTPDETLDRVAAYFAEHPVARIGVGSFGPLDLKRGTITTTPKLPWRDFDLRGAVERRTGAKVEIDTDVNAAALGEFRWGAAQGLDTFIYLTIGTGIGGGGMVNGRLMHGLLHPEMGHIRIPQDLVQDPYPGGCPSHGNCLEGLACGPAIETRWGVKGYALPPDHPAWDLEARYLALGVTNWICTLSPQRIILGGGVMNQPGLLAKIRSQVQHFLGGYVQMPEILTDIDQYLVSPGLGERSGILGSMALVIP